MLTLKNKKDPEDKRPQGPV